MDARELSATRMELFRQIVCIVSRNAFVVGLAAFAFFFFSDLVKPGFATNYLNLNCLLLFVIGFGIVTILLSDESQQYD